MTNEWKDKIPKENCITIDLQEFTPVQDHLDLSVVKRLFHVTASDYIDRFCNEIQMMVDESPADDLHLMNSSDDKSPKLFSKLGPVQWVQGYVGVLQFFIPEDKAPDHEAIKLTINIRSRFDNEGESHFLMYVFERTAGSRGKIFNQMHISGSQINIWDLLLATAFCSQLHDAVRKGMYRQYKDYPQNDSRLRGRIDIARYIRENIPFNGNVAYTSREYTVDNPINVLILRAYHHLERKYPILLRNIVASDDIVKHSIQFLQTEVMDWQKGSNYTVIQNADQKIVHNVYRNYEPLRKTAIAVLKQFGMNSFQQGDNNRNGRSVAGMLIDMPRLWEEFLHNTIFKDYTGTRGKYHQDPHPIIDGARYVKPDFLSDHLVLDAKYKVHWEKTFERSEKSQKEKIWNNVREDVYQIISYALIFNCKYCGVLFPISHDKIISPDQLEPVPISEACPDRFFIRVPYRIPSIDSNTASYQSAFEKSDAEVLETLRRLYDPLAVEEEVQPDNTEEE